MNQFKKIISTVSVIFCLGFQGIQAQTMYVNLKNGAQINYNTENIRKLNFSESKIVINKTATHSDTVALINLRSLTFNNLLVVKEPGVLTKDGFISLGQDSIIKLIVNEYRGNLQWQKTLDNVSWINIEGETWDTISVKSGSEAMYRAQIIEGECLPVYSDSAIVVTNSQSAVADLIETGKTNFVLISDSSAISKGEYIYTGSSEPNNFEVGKVIIEEQTGGTIRKITETRESGDTIFAKTEQATLEDIFYDESFKLSTSMVTPTQNLKSASMAEIEKALTDEEGFIHPVEVIYYNENGNVLKSVSIFSETSQQQQNNIHFHKDWSNLEIFNFSGSFSAPNKHGTIVSYTGNAKSTISEGYFTFDSDFKIECDFDPPGIDWDWSKTKIRKGELKSFKFYCDSALVDFKHVLDFDLSITGFEFGQEWPLFPKIINAKFKFVVGAVPVWVDVIMDLNCSLKASFAKATTTSNGFRNTNYLTLGAKYENKNWESIESIEKNYELIAAGKRDFGKMEFRFDLYPKVQMKLYSVIGPYFKMGPYFNYEVIASDNANWNKSINMGIDANVGVSADVLGMEIASFNANKSFLNTNLWQSPFRLNIISGNNQNADTSEVLPLPIVIEVRDSRNSPVENVRVYFEPSEKGSVDFSPAITNQAGLAQVSWKLSNKPGTNSLRVHIKNGKDSEIPGSSVMVFASSEVEDNPELPTVKTALITEIGKNSALCGGNVTKDGGAEITARGVCYSLESNPTILSGKTSDGEGPGEYVSTMTGLYPDTLYFVRAYATNTVGTAYGNQYSFKTQKEPDVIPVPDSIPETGELAIGGKIYKTIKIGNQVWMAENLAYNVGNGCWAFGNNESNVAVYGRLYSWDAASSACPSGWHLPFGFEWDDLAQYISDVKGPYSKSAEGWNNVGTHLKSETGWVSNSNGTDDFGFKGLPGGLRRENGDFLNILGAAGYWWSSTGSGGMATFRALVWNGTVFGHGEMIKDFGFSVRCIKD